MNMRLFTWLLAVLAPLAVNAQEPAPKPADAKTSEANPATMRPGAPWSPEEVNPAKPVPVTIANPDGDVWVIPLKGEVGPTQFYFLRRALKEAHRAGASAVVLDIDTFGGRVDSAMEEMDALLSSRLPTFAYVNTKAISAGSLISLATNRIYMHPNAVIGASAVVSGHGQDLQEDMSEKATSMVVAKARGAAAANGHAEDIAEAFVRKESEVKRGDKTLDGEKTLLTLNAPDASRTYGDHPLFAAGIADDIESVARQAGLKGAIRRFEPSGFETLAFWLTTFAPLLMIGGVVGAYIEMKAPGFGIPGICSLICFALFFGGHLIAGLAGWESVVVFAIGVALVLVELLVMPGALVPGIMGVLLIILSLVWAMVDHRPAGPDGSFAWPTGEQFERPMLNLVISVFGTSVVVMLLAKILPKTSLYNRLVLSAAVPAGEAVSMPVANLGVKTGDLGIASTTLRPAGKATFGSAMHDVISVGTFIPSGASVRVVDVDGTRVMVEQA
jgi:membrane-bound serine protease (ClpP class)